MIRNPDGSCYQVSGSLQQFDPENPEHNLLNSYYAEVVKIYGISIFYYELMIQTSSVDPLYVEDRGKLWSPIPIEIYALYDPKASQNAQSLFGIDAPDEMIFEFNYKDVLQRIGHPPKVGSRLFTPHKSENWELIQCGDTEFKLWGQYGLQMICRKLQESKTTSGMNKQPQVDFKLNP